MKKTFPSSFLIALLVYLGLICDMINAQSISGHGAISMFLCTNETVESTGINNAGQLGDGTTINRSSPVSIISLSGINAVAAGGTHSIFLKNDGNVWIVGFNNIGQLGDGTTISKNTPIQVPRINGIVAIAGGDFHSIFIKNDGTVFIH